jgi:hypothetical protein
MYSKGDLYQQAVAELRSALAEDPERADLLVVLADALDDPECLIVGVPDRPWIRMKSSAQSARRVWQEFGCPALDRSNVAAGRVQLA